MKPLTALAILSAAALLCSSAQAATIIYAGADTTTSGAWRTSSVIKPLDSDGNNIYGTQGYFIVSSTAVQANPSYATVATTPLTATYGGNPGYTSVDNPAGAGTVTTGIWYKVSAENTEDTLATITMTAASSFRVGVLVDNGDYLDFTPSTLRVFQTTGGTANSGFINSYLEVNHDSDWYFFDIVNAQAGDVFTISGTNAYAGSGQQNVNAIGGLTFDALAVPEPMTGMLGLMGLAAMALRRRRSALY